MATSQIPKITHAVWLSIALLLVSLIISSTIALQPEQTLPQVTQLLLGVCLFALIQHFLRRQPHLLTYLPPLLTSLAAALALLAPLGVHWSASTPPFIPPELYRALPQWLANSIHPNVMAGYLVILLPFPLAAVYWQHTRPPFRPFYTAALVFIILILLATQSRAALLALAVVLLSLVSLTRGKGWRIVFAVLTTSLFGIGVWLLLSSNPLELSLNLRREAWQRAIYLIQDFPLGIGIGQYTPMVARFYPFFLSLPGEVPHAHNLLLQIAVDIGLPGLWAWLCLIGIVLRASWHIFQQHATRVLGGGLLLSQIALLTHGIFDAVTWGMVRPAIFVWVLWAIALAAYPQNPPQPAASRPKATIWIFFIWILLTVLSAWQSFYAYRALDVLRPQISPPPAASTPPCASLASAVFTPLGSQVRAAFGSALLSINCPDRAAQILPPFDSHARRADLLAYHWGRVFWQRGDPTQAADSWQHAPQITNLLILQAKNLPSSTDLATAELHFRTAVLAAPASPQFATALFFYTNFLKNHPNDFDRVALIEKLSTAYPLNSALYIRIRAEHALAQRDFAQAQHQLTQAIELGITDSETWFLLAEILRLQPESVDATRAAYTAALNTKIQVPQRAAHYAYRYATLLINNNRPQDALPLLKQAASQAQSYIYWDELAQLYAQLGQAQSAQLACKTAIFLAGENTAALECPQLP